MYTGFQDVCLETVKLFVLRLPECAFCQFASLEKRCLELQSHDSWGELNQAKTCVKDEHETSFHEVKLT